MEKGTIFNIQKYSVHDGPGIRTTVFLKGCPLSCLWCHNPESQFSGRELLLFSGRCIGCGSCVRSCPSGALSMMNGKIIFNREICTICGECAEACPTNAREIAGKTLTVDYVMGEIMKDRVFYEESGGGVTFSGGEPLVQHSFLKELLLECTREGIHTTLDTSGFAPAEVIKKVMPHIDLFLYDLKLMDDKKHIEYVGVSNKIILENMKIISEAGKKIFARMPVIPGINDSDEDINAVIEFLSPLNIAQVNLLPYHAFAMDKYGRLNRDYKLKDTIEPSEEHMLNLAAKLRNHGLNIKIGG